jgi:DUF4097 and DUF4098 domain-containing protein YvlB
MKRVLIVVILIIGAAVLGLWRSQGGVRAGLNRVISGSREKNSAGATGDETRKTFDLKPGAHVEIQGVNGSVEIQTSDTKTAEVYVRRSADNPTSLGRRELTIEQTSDGFVVRSRQNHVGLWEHLFGKDPKEEVTIKAPRQIALSVRGVNGRVNSGIIEGALEIRGVNGRVEVEQAGDSGEVSGINGSIAVGLKQLSERGLRISGVNGGIELKLSSGLNADLNAHGMNGSVRSEIVDVTVDRQDSWSRYSAHIGKGGPAIEINGINGNVRLTRLDGGPSSASSNVPDKNAAQNQAPEKGATSAPKSAQ